MFKPVIVSRRKEAAHDIEIWQGDVEEFDQDESREIVFVITPPQMQQDDDLARDIMRAGYDVEKLPEGNVYVVTSRVQMPDHFWIYHTPFVGSMNCAPSPPSDARYHLKYSIPYCGILWQKLKRAPEKKYAQTSSHYHNKQSEKWLVLNGSGTLLFRPHGHCGEPWAARDMHRGDCLEILPKIEHQLRTSSGFNTILVMSGDPDGFSLTDHVYVEPPPADMVII
jgi:mannose-6-phosphate isomerase-like protein (cupin superfamily)